MVQKGRIQENWVLKSLWLCLFVLCLRPPGRGAPGAAGTCPGWLRWCSKPAFLPIPPLCSATASCHVHQIIVKSTVLQLGDQKHGAGGRQETPQLSACFPPLTAHEQYGICFDQCMKCITSIEFCFGTGDGGWQMDTVTWISLFKVKGKREKQLKGKNLNCLGKLCGTESLLSRNTNAAHFIKFLHGQNSYILPDLKKWLWIWPITNAESICRNHLF